MPVTLLWAICPTCGVKQFAGFWNQTREPSHQEILTAAIKQGWDIDNSGKAKRCFNCVKPKIVDRLTDVG